MKDLVRDFFSSLPSKMAEEDKRKHMAWSFWLTLLALLLWPPTVAFAAVFLLGFIKECWDFFFGSGFCLFDITGNLIGSAAGMLCGHLLFIWLANLQIH